MHRNNRHRRAARLARRARLRLSSNIGETAVTFCAKCLFRNLQFHTLSLDRIVTSVDSVNNNINSANCSGPSGTNVVLIIIICKCIEPRRYFVLLEPALFSTKLIIHKNDSLKFNFILTCIFR